MASLEMDFLLVYVFLFIGLAWCGIVFAFMGIIFFILDIILFKGNINIILLGVILFVCLEPIRQLFTEPKNYMGIILFGFGFYLFKIGWPFSGMILELYSYCVSSKLILEIVMLPFTHMLLYLHVRDL